MLEEEERGKKEMGSVREGDPRCSRRRREARRRCRGGKREM